MFIVGIAFMAAIAASGISVLMLLYRRRCSVYSAQRDQPSQAEWPLRLRLSERMSSGLRQRLARLPGFASPDESPRLSDEGHWWFESIMTRPIQQSLTLNAAPRELFNTFLDSKKHAALTGAPAK